MLFPFALTSFSTLGRIQTGLALVSLLRWFSLYARLMKRPSFYGYGEYAFINYLCPMVKARKCSPLHIGTGVKRHGKCR